MKKLIIIASLFFITTSFQTHSTNSGLKNSVKNDSFLTGEKLSYRLHYGWITAGEATLNISPYLKNIKGKKCYDFKINGRTTGAFASVIRIEDQWRSLVDTTTLHPIQFSRHIEEAGYFLKEKVDFDNDSTAKVTWEKRDKVKKYDNFEVPLNVHDIVSGYYYLRNVNFSSMKLLSRGFTRELNSTIVLYSCIYLFSLSSRYFGLHTSMTGGASTKVSDI